MAASPARRRRRSFGAAIAIGAAIVIGAVMAAAEASLVWSVGSALTGGAVGYGAGWLAGGGEDGTDLGDGSGLGLSVDGDLGDFT